MNNLGLSAHLLQVAKELGFTTPTPVQAQSIPVLLQGKDVIAQAQTGSGKTAAFALPILETLALRPKRIQALILSPTRELCAQVTREIRKLGRTMPGLQVLSLAGGSPIGPQFGALERGVHIVVGTPGRVLDHLGRASLDLSDVTKVVLDEADRMLEMGFQEDMEKILSRVPEQRQMALFSATFPRTIEALSRSYQKSPVRITIERDEQAVQKIEQLAYRVEAEDRPEALLHLLGHFESESTIVFCNLKISVTELASYLAEAGVSVDALHGDLEQRDRDRIMAKFRNRSLRVLVATDVAARGIDVENLGLVVNYELPVQPEIYVHRVGRTGRAGQSGRAVSFCSQREIPKLESIERYTSTEIERAELPDVPDVGESEETAHADSVEAPTATMRTLFISGGRKEKVRPGDILGALTGEAGGFKSADIGKIEIHDHFSYVAVSASIFEAALQCLRDGRIKGRKFRVEPVR